MERGELERYLDRGLSLAQIGELVGRDPTTVSYWLRKYGLKPANQGRHGARGGLAREQLEPLVSQGSSLRATASELEVSVSTVRHWVERYGLTTRRMSRLQETREARRGHTRSLAEARGEARKCVLLCSNCHAEVEGGIVSLPEGCLERCTR